MTDFLTHVVNPTFDALLQRRPYSWYVGKVLWVKGDMIPPGWPEGFYIPTRLNEDDTYDYHFCGTTPPPGEPIYIHDGSRDLKAVPSTVVPSVGTFVFWFAAYLASAIFMTVSDLSHDPIWFAFLFPVAVIPFFQWFMNVEPVRGTKVAAAILVTHAALAAKHRRDWERYQQINERYR